MQNVIRRGEIYSADLSGYIGAEQAGVRPVLIIQNDSGNTYSPATIVVPLTTKHKPKMPTHALLTPDDCGILQDSTVLCEQLRVIDKSRLRQKLGKVECMKKIEEINKGLMISMGLEAIYGRKIN